MASKRNSRRGKKRSSAIANPMERKAELLIRTVGKKIGFIGGTVFETVSIQGFNEIVAGDPDKENTKEMIRRCLMNNRRRWTVAFGLIRTTVENDFTIDLDHYWIENCTTTEVSPVVTDQMQKEWVPFREKYGDDCIGNVWIAIPYSTSDADEVLESFDDYLEERGVFDVELSKERLKLNVDKSTIAQNK